MMSTPKTKAERRSSAAKPNPAAPDWKSQLKNQKAMSKPNFKNDQAPREGSSRLDAIYAQLKNLQSFKDEIMGDLEEFMDDVESNSGVVMPQQFEEVVDIVVSDSRAKANEKVMKDDGGDEPKSSYDQTMVKMGLEEKEEKPFWTKFLRSDYLEEEDKAPLLPQVMDVLEGNKGVDEMLMEQQNPYVIENQLELYQEPETPKKSENTDKIDKEWAKIRKLEQQLGAASKA